MYISTFKRKQRRNAVKLHKSRAWKPATDDKVLALTKALQSARKANQKLASINTNLRKQVKQFTYMEMSWVQERGRLVHENRSLQRRLGRKYIHAKKEINRLERVLKASETIKCEALKVRVKEDLV